MIIDGTYAIINQIIFNLNFDNTNKSVVMKKDDIVGITYKKDGEKLYIKGRLDEIRTVPNPNTNSSVVYIKIDGSEEYAGRVVVVIPENVLDIILFETTSTIINPVLSVNDLSKRIILLMENEDGQLLYSKDGITWGTPARGLQGISAYEVAVENGFVGTEEEWLASLKGDKGIDGVDGKSAYQIAVDGGFIGTEEEWILSLKGDKGIDGINGIDGESAYQLAVDNGYIGTEAEWLESLKGEKGADGIIGVDGKSAYQIAIDDGFSGTEDEWLKSLKGKDGTNGEDGKSAYEIAIDDGFSGTEDEWLKSLKGEDGDEGPKGDDGSNGDPGKSAYQLAVDNGFSGTEEEWLESLKGERGPSGGEQGKSAYEVAVENGFVGSEPEWLESLKGANGTDGEDGKSAYEVAVENGFVGTEEEWLEFIKGAPGDRGQKGDQGQKGDTPYIDDDTGRWFIAGQDTGKVAVPNIIDIPEIPTALSQLENDENFIKNTVNNLINYYLKSDTYTKQEINNILGGLSTVTISVVSELPAENISTNTIYLIDIGNGVFSQHIYINGEWASFGDTSVNLENYVTQANLQAGLNTKSELNHTHAELHTHPNKPVLDTITSESVTKWNNGFSGKYNDLTGTPDIPTVTNDLTDELKTSYDQAVDEMHVHVNKPVLDKFTESVTGNVLYDGKEISTGGSGGTSIDDETTSLSKTWSSQKISSEIDIVGTIANDINIAQKTVNSNLDFFYGRPNGITTPVLNQNINFVRKDGNMVSTNGKIQLKPNTSYEFTIALGYVEISTYADIQYKLMAGDVEIALFAPYRGNGQYEYPYTCNCTYTNNTGNNVDFQILVSRINVNDKILDTLSSLTVKEIGHSIVIDPVNHINTTQGIEDTPVGHILSVTGVTAPKHYLICDGAEYNIADYPYLSQYIKDQFGTFNFFGGDGITTFAVPYRNMENDYDDITPIMTSNETPFPYVVTSSSVYDSSYGPWKAFNGTSVNSSDAWLSVNGGGTSEWIQIKLNKITTIDRFLMASRNVTWSNSPKSITLQGSNNGTTFTNIQSFSNINWSGGVETKEFKLTSVASYLYYRFSVTGTYTGAYIAIGDIKLCHLSKNKNLQCIKYEPTYFMNVRGLLEEKVLWSGSSIFKCVNNAYNNINTDISLIDSILNYDEVRFAYSWYRSTDKQTQNYEQKVFIVKDIVLNKSILLNIVSSFNMICELSFITGNSIRVSRTYSKDLNQTSGDSIELTNITCVKYKTEQSQGGGNCDCPTYTNDEIREYLEGIYYGD